MASLQNQVVAILGGASGMGLATSQILLARRARVAVFDISTDNLQRFYIGLPAEQSDNWTPGHELGSREVTADELVYALDTVNIGPAQHLGFAALSNTKIWCLITLNPVSDAEPGATIVGEKMAGYEYRLAFGFSALYPKLSMVFWENIADWLRNGVIRPVRFEVIYGLNMEEVNKALDSYRDGQGSKIVLLP